MFSLQAVVMVNYGQQVSRASERSRAKALAQDPTHSPISLISRFDPFMPTHKGAPVVLSRASARVLVVLARTRGGSFVDAIVRVGRASLFSRHRSLLPWAADDHSRCDPNYGRSWEPGPARQHRRLEMSRGWLA